MRLTPEQRHTIVNAIRRGINKKIVAQVFNISRITVWRWCKRVFHPGKESFRDKPRKPKSKKITKKVELSILSIRVLFEWGTGSIQQGLMKLPSYMKKVIPNCVQGLKLSRASVNNVLKKHKLNGYKKKNKGWKFFRAKKPDELWQLDIKGPFRVRGKRYWFLVCIDDYSRYLLLAEQFDHSPSTDEITNLLENLSRKPEKLLTDNGVQFKRKWEKWCKRNGVKPLFAHPYYPQDKGKVERAIRNVAEEFVYLLIKFPEWLNGKIKDYRKWYNRDRFHRGINSQPVKLYIC